MENYIVINGKKAELTKEQLKKLGIEVKKESVFTVEPYQDYYFINAKGEVQTDINASLEVHDLYEVGNLCTDKNLMKQRALHETLDRLLWRFTYENGWSEDLWKHYGIKTSIYQDRDGEFFVYGNHNFKYRQIYYKDKETAQRAIDEIIKPFMEKHPDFVW